MSDDTPFELELTAMAHGGSALGRHEGRAVFVPYAIPGERITARITRDRGRFAAAEVVSVLVLSEARVEPRCPHFGPGRCGGCHWQHIDYPAQLAFKRQVVIDQMARIGGFRDVTVHPTIPSPDPWRYRSHITFHVTDAGQLGFVSTDDRTVIPIEECHIIRPELLEMFNDLTADSLPNVERVRLQVGSDGRERLGAIVDGGRAGDGGLQNVHYTLKGRTFRVSAGSFFQVNLAQAEALVDLATVQLALRGAEHVLDLYSGVGLFTAFLAERAAHVTAVESYPLAVRDARYNLAEFENVRLVEGTVEAFLSELDETYDFAVLDPPRAGVDAKALAALVRRSPARIVYISCDPATLARDARRLAEGGYDLLDVQPVDMFPQTYHVEAAAAFKRRA